MYINVGANNGSEKLLTKKKKTTATLVYYVHEVARKNACFELDGFHSGLAAGSFFRRLFFSSSNLLFRSLY